MNALKARSRVLCVGGTDPTGSAGLLADQLALGALGLMGQAAVTAITVQTSASVSEILPTPASTVGAQIDAACSEGAPACLKAGMLVGVDIVLALAARVDRLGSQTKLVVDPVLAASSGRRLLDAEGQTALVRELLPRAALITPNALEAELLTGVPVRGPEDMGVAADHLLALGASAVLIKGGHVPMSDVPTPRESEQQLGEQNLGEPPDEVMDLLRTIDGDEKRFCRPRLSGPGFRGTGCTLATAIAAWLAEGHTLQSSVEQAGDWVHAAMKNALELAGPKPEGPLRLLLPPSPLALLGQ